MGCQLSEVTMITCGLCDYEFKHGVQVCRGCQGRVVYGATPAEATDSGKFGAIAGGVLVAVVLFGLPGLLNEHLGFTVPHAFGLGLWSIVGIVSGAVVGALTASTICHARYAGTVRTFR